MAAGKDGDDKQAPGKAGFTVSDRRSFSESGEPKAEAAPSAAPVEAKPAATAPPPAAGSTGLPTVDFHTFILSLGSSALLHLGELDHPEGDEAKPDLPLAKHTIDIIAMLQEKTKGNLSPPEERLMESLLYDLRLRYVERNKSGRQPGR